MPQISACTLWESKEHACQVFKQAFLQSMGARVAYLHFRHTQAARPSQYGTIRMNTCTSHTPNFPPFNTPLNSFSQTCRDENRPKEFYKLPLPHKPWIIANQDPLIMLWVSRYLLHVAEFFSVTPFGLVRYFKYTKYLPNYLVVERMYKWDE